MSQLEAIWTTSPTGERAPRQSVCVEAGSGLSGDRYEARKSRQILFVSTGELGELGLVPGQLKEQITVSLQGLQSLAAGTKVQVGAVTFEVEQDCAPCSHMAVELGRDPHEFREQAKGKRGMFCRSLTSGEIHVGDPIQVVPN